MEEIKQKHINSEDTTNFLVEENIKLAYYNAGQWLKKGIPLPFSDLVSDCTLGLFKAAKTFNIDNGTLFSTYATVVMDNQVRMSLRKIKKNQAMIPFADVVVEDKEGQIKEKPDLTIDIMAEYQITKWIEIEFLQKQFSKLNKRDKLIAKYTFLDGKKQGEISAILNLSQSYISRRLANIRKIIKKSYLPYK